MTLDIRDILHDGVQPNRAAENLTIIGSPHGGFTEYQKKRVAKIAAPLASGAYARTVRIHELLHANRSPVTGNRKVHPIAYNAIEDARVHSVYWPDKMPARANRDCLAAEATQLSVFSTSKRFTIPCGSARRSAINPQPIRSRVRPGHRGMI